MDRESLLRVREDAELLAGKEQVSQVMDRLAREIETVVGDSDPLILCVMTGGMITASELFLRLTCPAQLDYLHATRYQGNRASPELEWIARPSRSLAGRTLVVVDDILDEGLTLAEIMRYCRDQQAQAVYSAVLVEKLHARKAHDVRADFVGLQVEDRYVFGYGMDYHGYWRNLDGIYAVPEAD